MKKYLSQNFNHQQSNNLDESLIPHPLSSEQALARVHNPFGCYSLILILTLSIAFSTLGCVAYGFAYLQDVQHLNITCTSPSSSQPFACTAQQACSGNLDYQIDIKSPHTLRNWVYDYDIFCMAANNQLTWLATTYFIAFLISSISSSVLADTYGRKPVVISGLILHLVLLVVLVSMIWRSYWMLMIVMFGFGIRAPMASHVAAVLQTQLGGPKMRSYLAMAITFFDNFISLLLPIYYYYIGDWRYVMYFNFVVVILSLVLICTIVPESPRFYASMREFAKAREVYERLAKMSGRKMFVEKLQGQEEIQKLQKENQENQKLEREFEGGEVMANNIFQQSDEENRFISSSNKILIKSDRAKKKQQLKAIVSKESKTNSKARCCDMMRPSSPYLYPSVFLSLALTCVAIIFYGTIMGMNSFHGSILINGSMVGCADITAAILIGVFANYFGRVKYFKIACIVLIFAFSMYFIAGLIQSLYFLTYVSVLLGKFAATTKFSLIFLILYETFPTSHRSTMSGSISAISRFGAALGPVIISFFNNSFMFIFIGMGILCFIGSMKLEETLGKAMPDQIQQKKGE